MNLKDKEDYYFDCPTFHGLIKVSLCNINHELSKPRASFNSPEKSVQKANRSKCNNCKFRESLTEDQLIEPQIVHNKIETFLSTTKTAPKNIAHTIFEKETGEKPEDDFSYV